MVTMKNVLAISLMILIGVAVPIGGALLWKFRKKEKITTILLGAASFFVFAVVLETFPKLLLFQKTNPVGNFVLTHPIVYCIAGAFLAGIFEETGRFVVFKFLLRKRNTRRTAISYGIGHGGFEVLFLMGYAGVQYLVYAIMILTGAYAFLVEQVAAVQPESVAALEALPAQIAQIDFAAIGMAVWERTSAVLLHIGCSIIVFYAVKKPGKLWLYPVAILIHAAMDLLAVFYQVGWITNIYLLECAITITGLAVFLGAYFLLYKKMPDELPYNGNQESGKEIADAQLLTESEIDTNTED